MLDLCPINTQANRRAKTSHGNFSLFCRRAEMSTRIVLLKLKLKYVCLQSKTSFFYDLEASDNNEHRKCQRCLRMSGRLTPEISFFFPSTLSRSQIKSNLFNSSVNNSLGWQSGRSADGGRGVLVLLPLWAAKNIETLSHINIANLFANGFQRLWIIGCEILFVQVFHVIEFCIEKYCGWLLEEYRKDRIVHFEVRFSPLWSAQINSHPDVATSHDCHTLTSWLMLQCAHVLNYKTTRVRPFPIKRPVVGAPFVAPFWDDVHMLTFWSSQIGFMQPLFRPKRGLCQQSSVSSALISMLMWAAAYLTRMAFHSCSHRPMCTCGSDSQLDTCWQSRMMYLIIVSGGEGRIGLLDADLTPRLNQSPCPPLDSSPRDPPSQPQKAQVKQILALENFLVLKLCPGRNKLGLKSEVDSGFLPHFDCMFQTKSCRIVKK